MKNNNDGEMVVDVELPDDISETERARIVGFSNGLYTAIKTIHTIADIFERGMPNAISTYAKTTTRERHDDTA